MKYEIVHTDPFYNRYALAKARKSRAKLTAPVYIEPFMALLFKGVYRVWSTLMQVVFWSFYKLDVKARELCDV